MGDAFQCDRCGDLCEGTPSKRVTSTVPIANNLVSGLKVSPFEGNKGKALCAECAMKFDRFMSGASVAPENSLGWLKAVSVSNDPEAAKTETSIGYTAGDGDNGGGGSTGTYGAFGGESMITMTIGSSYNTKDGEEPETPDYFEAGGRNY